MTKKQRVDAGEWLVRVIDCVREHQDNMSEEQMYATLRCTASQHTESLIYEHPSLLCRERRIRFRQFANISSKETLLAFLTSNHPSCYRRVDFHGLYLFVNADIDELLFFKHAVILDPLTESISTARAPYTLSREFIAAWHQA